MHTPTQKYRPSFGPVGTDESDVNLFSNNQYFPKVFHRLLSAHTRRALNRRMRRAISWDHLTRCYVIESDQRQRYL